MSDFKPLNLVHRDGRERTVTTAREEVSARFDGFADKRTVAKVAKAASKAAKAPATRKATASPTEAAKGAPPADNASAAPNA